jgi:hypothetical protein
MRHRPECRSFGPRFREVWENPALTGGATPCRAFGPGDNRASHCPARIRIVIKNQPIESAVFRTPAQADEHFLKRGGRGYRGWTRRETHASGEGDSAARERP